ncbi:MAG: Carboxypeptidase Aqualysin 1 [Thermoleophilia bacterium]|nr:Carboxypeptidase Aqualysin 1 [Thermoleophilia bacterium]
MILTSSPTAAATRLPAPIPPVDASLAGSPDYVARRAPASPAPSDVRAEQTAFEADPYDPAVVQARLEAGRRAELTSDELPQHLVGKGAPTYFRSYEQLKSAMYELQATYPDLVEVRDIGDTWEKTQGTADRDVLALVLSNRTIAGDKPSTMHIGGIHAREIANPELLMTFATQLLAGHGRDAEATMLLDSRETVLVPMLNADGHAMVERGFEGAKGGDLMKRKNTSGPGDGVDLNRNYEYHWGGAGASSSPRSETYRGPSAGSEPETKAIQAYLKAHKPDVFIDWHSYSRLNMFPWGDTKEPSKDHLAFKAIAEKFTTYNGYSPMQSVQLYPTTGTTDDHAYGADGVPALAIETGSSFHQSDAEFAKTLRENLPVLTYAVKIADSPFTRVFGPDAIDAVVDPATKQVSARLTDANNGKQAIAGAELVLDTAAAPGSGVALQAADGAFDEVDETVVGSAAALPGLSPDAGDGTLVYVRGRDAQGNWGPLAAQWLTGPAARAVQPAR